MGPDGIHPRLLKDCAQNLCIPLKIIFSLSLDSGCLPSLWKRSDILPLHKKGPRYDPLNYRPISLTSAVGKSLERIIAKHLMNYLESNNILSSIQYGFRSGRSTLDQLMLTYNDVSLA